MTNTTKIGKALQQSDQGPISPTEIPRQDELVDIANIMANPSRGEPDLNEMATMRLLLQMRARAAARQQQTGGVSPVTPQNSPSTSPR